VRRDEIDFSPNQLRLLMREICNKPIRRENARVGVGPIVSNPPIADENDQWCHPRRETAVFPNHLSDVKSIVSRLAQAIAFLLSFADEESRAVPKADFSRPAAEFRLDSEHTGWPDQHMVDVETFADDIVDRPVTDCPQLFEAFSNRQLAALPAIQIAKPKEEAAVNDRGYAGSNDRCTKHRRWHWRLMIAELVPFPDPEDPKESSAEVERHHPIFNQSFLLIAQRLSWQSFRHAGGGASFMPRADICLFSNEKTVRPDPAITRRRLVADT
jgi:hypothetical protein